MKQQYTTEIVHTRCRPRFHHEYALSRLKAMGYKLAVASNSIRYTVELMMEKAHLTRYLDLMLSNQDVTHGKPDPEIYLTAMARLSLSASECLVVEDHENGIRAARAAGAPVLVVRDVAETNLTNLMRMIRSLDGDTLS
jgi:HAD superfamily hydrolase (TIGR01509 family)